MMTRVESIYLVHKIALFGVVGWWGGGGVCKYGYGVWLHDLMGVVTQHYGVELILN